MVAVQDSRVIEIKTDFFAHAVNAHAVDAHDLESDAHPDVPDGPAAKSAPLIQ